MAIARCGAVAVLLITALVASDSDETRHACTKAIANLLCEEEVRCRPPSRGLASRFAARLSIGLLREVAPSRALPPRMLWVMSDYSIGVDLSCSGSPLGVIHAPRPRPAISSGESAPFPIAGRMMRARGVRCVARERPRRSRVPPEHGAVAATVCGGAPAMGVGRNATPVAKGHTRPAPRLSSRYRSQGNYIRHPVVGAVKALVGSVFPGPRTRTLGEAFLRTVGPGPEHRARARRGCSIPKVADGLLAGDRRRHGLRGRRPSRSAVIGIPASSVPREAGSGATGPL